MNIVAFKVVFILGFIINIASGQNQIPPSMKTEIDNLIKENMGSLNTPSLALAIIKNNGEILYTNGYGLSNIENNITADNSTLFAIGSITKSFTATIVVKVLNEKYPELGEGALDIPIKQLVPSYDFTLSDRYRTENTNFRDLLSHRTCLLPEALGLWMEAFDDNREEYLYRERYAPEACNFRTGYVYNNAIVTLAGDIIAHIANSTYENLLLDLMSQIGMSGSTFVRLSDDHNNMPGRSIPYYQMSGQLYRYNSELLKSVTVENAAGGILSSANDMVKYLQFHLNYGKVGQTQIVPESVMKWLQRPSNMLNYGTFKKDQEDTIDMIYASGLNLELGTYDGWRLITHGGFLPPFDSLIKFFPELNLGIFTSASGPTTSLLTDFPNTVLHNQIFRVIQGLNASKVISENKRKTTTESSVKSKYTYQESSIKIEPAEIVGNFGNGMSGQLNCSLRINSTGLLQPYLSFGIWGKSWLTQISNSTFKIEWDTDFWQFYLTTSPPGEVMDFYLDFPDVNTLRFIQNGIQAGGDFKRDQTLDQLPQIPWSPESCGPEN